MTDTSEFRRVFEEFRRARYPDYPDFVDLQDWNSHLLTIDAYAAGYASQVYKGLMMVQDLPDLENLINDVIILKVQLKEIIASSDRGMKQVSDYEIYLLTLERLVTVMRSLALEQSG